MCCFWRNGFHQILFQVLNDQKAEGILIDALDEVDDAMKEAERRAFEEECERLCESVYYFLIQNSPLTIRDVGQQH